VSLRAGRGRRRWRIGVRRVGREDCPKALEAEIVLIDGCPAVSLLSGNEPESSGGGVEFIEQRPIIMGCALLAITDPALVAKNFQVAADSRLGKLEDIAEFGNAEFLAFEEPEEAQTGGVGEGTEPIEDLFGVLVYLSFHPSIRIE
jgi:hypothetical protein